MLSAAAQEVKVQYDYQYCGNLGNLGLSEDKP